MKPQIGFFDYQSSSTCISECGTPSWACFNFSLTLLGFETYIQYYPYYFLRVRGTDRKTQSPLVGPDWVIIIQNRVLLVLTTCFMTPSLSNFCQKIISFQCFEMGLTSLPPIWTMSLSILLLFFGSTPKKDQAICWTVMNHWNILSSLESRHTLPSLVSFYLGWWHWTWPRKEATDLGRILKKR